MPEIDAHCLLCGEFYRGRHLSPHSEVGAMSDQIDMEAARVAAQSLAQAGEQLLDGMDAQTAFHSLLSGAVLFGTAYFGRDRITCYLRMVADTLEKSALQH